MLIQVPIKVTTLTNEDIGRKFKFNKMNRNIIWVLKSINHIGGLVCKYEFRDLEDFDCPYCAWIKDDEELNCITHEVLDEEEQGKVEQLTLW